jgi:hypothetical protein
MPSSTAEGAFLPMVSEGGFRGRIQPLQGVMRLLCSRTALWHVRCSLLIHNHRFDTLRFKGKPL